jgi:hypothetical protein
MAASMKSIFSTTLTVAMLIAAATVKAQSAPSAVPVPFSIGLAGPTYVAATSGCTEIAATSGTNYGDGCPPAGAQLTAPQGVAVDKYGNIYVADYTDHLVRVIYNGGANIAAAITAANSGYAISASSRAPAPAPVVGNIYTIAGFGGTTTLSATSTDGSGKYACANYATSGQPDALNILGDGCPAASATIGARDVAVDSDGNLFLTDYTNSRIRVLCVNCTSATMATQLIELEEPGVVPVNGAMYTIAGYAAGYRDQALGFGNATIASSAVALLRMPTGVVVSSSDDVYIADNMNNAVRLLYNGGTVAKNILVADGYTPTLGYVYTIAGDDCVSALTTKTGSVPTANVCLITTSSSPDTAMVESFTTASSTGVITANGAPAGTPWAVYLDANNNLYYSDAANARVKVIYGGVAAPLDFPNTTYATLKTGYAYTFAGGGTLAVSGVKPNQLLLSSIQGVGGDSEGDIFFIDYGTSLFYETYAQTGLTSVIGGGTAVTMPAAGTICDGGTTGPAMNDAFYDGCPLTQVKIASPRGPIVADASGNLYFGDAVGYVLHKFTYNPTFATTAVGGTSSTQSYAFTFLSAQTLAAPGFTLEGATASSFVDAGGDTCTVGLVAAGGGPGTTCVVNAAFSPQRPGVSAGAVELNSATAVLGASLVGGVGTGAGLTVDPATATTVGTGLVPNGIVVDGAGRVLVTDTASKSLLRYTSGTAATVAAGFATPSGVAIDGVGNIFVADSSANTVTELPVTGTKFTLTTAVSSPHGLATDDYGNLYVADTGNNRVLMFGPGAIVSVVAGFTGLSAPQAVAVDAVGDVYAADSSHVVKLTALGVQTTVASGGATSVAVDAAGNVLVTAGTTLVEYPASGAGAVTLSSALVAPKALVLDASEDAFVADSGYVGYVELQRTAGYYAFSSTSTSVPVYLTNVGNASLTAPTYTQTDSTDFTVASATTNGCSGALVAGAECALNASFAPTVAGALMDTVTFSSNAGNGSPINLTLNGAASAENTTTALSVSTATLVYGNVETLTAMVSATLATPTTGTVNFYDNAVTLLGSASVGAGGVATLNFVPGVGTYPAVTAVFVPGSTTYITSTSTAKSFAVTPALLTVTANTASRFYNVANPAFGYSVTGFVNNDTQGSAVGGAPVETTTATTTSPVGSYTITITQGTLTAANYTFVLVNGTLTITGATTQTVAFGALPGVTYGVAPIGLSATATSGLAVSYTVSGPATVSGSSLTITGAGAVTVTANQVGNNTYAAAPAVPQGFSVAKATLSVVATSASRVYGATNPTLTYGITGFVNNDLQATATTGAPAESTTAVVSSGVASYPITLTAGTLGSNNYAFTFTNSTLTVTAATLTLTANSVTRVYGSANPTFSGTLSGAVNNDQLTETFATSAVTTSPVAAYAIVPSAAGTNVGNYSIVATNGTLTITQAKPTITLSTTATSGFNGATSITLTAILTSPTSGVPTGTVSFYTGTTLVGSAPVNAGTAVLATTALPVGADMVTAAYSDDTNFSAVTSQSILITIAAGFGATSSTTALAFQPNYQEAQAVLTINPGGRTDTLSFSCQGLPTKLSCAFSPVTLPLSGLSAAQSVQLLVSNSGATASVREAPVDGRFVHGTVVLAMLPLAAILLAGLRKRRLPMLMLLGLLTLGAAAGLSGCGTSPTSLQQNAGSYPFTVSINSGSTTLQTISFTVMVP